MHACIVYVYLSNKKHQILYMILFLPLKIHSSALETPGTFQITHPLSLKSSKVNKELKR